MPNARYRALPLVESAYRANVRLFGPEHRETLSSRMVLGALYLRDRKFDLAREALSSVAAIASRKFGPQTISPGPRHKP